MSITAKKLQLNQETLRHLTQTHARFDITDSCMTDCPICRTQVGPFCPPGPAPTNELAAPPPPGVMFP